MPMSASVIGIRRGSFCTVRGPVSQNDCFMRVKLSVCAAYRVSVIALSRPPRVNQHKASLRKEKNLAMFLL